MPTKKGYFRLFLMVKLELGEAEQLTIASMDFTYKDLNAWLEKTTDCFWAVSPESSKDNILKVLEEFPEYYEWRIPTVDYTIFDIVRNPLVNGDA